jgi:Ca-activated chloride channel family protein
MNQQASALTGHKGERIALRDVSVAAVLQDLLAEVTVSQTYRNDEPDNIEAVYTFPLPLDAVLLDLEVEIGGRRLKGKVIARKEAEENYEEAVEAGDAAVMLEAIESGLYTMNVGNLLPNETATITFRYALLYHWTGDRLRFFLPTTIAPRFGASPHQPHQTPEASLTAENQFSLRIEVSGALHEAQFTCPSHAIELEKSADKVVISFTKTKAVMDRDFILNVRAVHAARSFVLCGPDGEGGAGIASFQPFFPGLQQPRHLNLAILIDCSGSMVGDSIAQARQALEGILGGLQPQDTMTLIAFGSLTKELSEYLLPCTKTNLSKARRFAQTLEADMGGTEIGHALRKAYLAMRNSGKADILLVTDGEVSQWQMVVDEARKFGHRIFTVGVGSAVSEAFMRSLSSSTGGECELVSPREGMADRVVRHFERMRAARARSVKVHWPGQAQGVTPAIPGAVFEGDTVIVSAQFSELPVSGPVVLEVETENGDINRQELAIEITPPAEPLISTVARLAASERLKSADAVTGPETALRYQLVSPWTNCLVIAERAVGEKAEAIPALRKVPQALAAGWGGTGSVAAYSSQSTGSSPRVLSFICEEMPADEGDSQSDPTESPPQAAGEETSKPVRRLLALIKDQPARLQARHILGLLAEAGLAQDFEDIFHHAEGLGVRSEWVAMIVLANLLESLTGEVLATDMQKANVQLKGRARQTMEALQEMLHHGMALLRVLEDPRVWEFFQQDPSHQLKSMLKCNAGIHDLLIHMREVEGGLLGQLKSDKSDAVPLFEQ